MNQCVARLIDRMCWDKLLSSNRSGLLQSFRAFFISDAAFISFYTRWLSYR